VHIGRRNALQRPTAVLRLLATVLIAAALVCTPGIAQALFTATAKGQVTASTLTLVQPVGANITASCNNRLLIIYPSNNGTVPRATSYEFTVTNPSGTTVPTPSGYYFTSAAAKGTWTAQIRGIYTVNAGNIWRGDPYTETVTCS
jgi:hypothetical protein